MTGYGRLELGNAGALGTGVANLTLDGTLAYTDAPSVPTTVTTDRSLTFAGAGFLDYIEVQNANVNLTFAGGLNTVSTANAFRKTGAGTLTFSNAGVNTLASGDFQIEEGAVVFENGTFDKARVNIGFQNGSGDFFVGDTAGKSASLVARNGAVVNNNGLLSLGVDGGTGTLTLTGNSQFTASALDASQFGANGGTASVSLDGTSSTQFSKLSCAYAAWFGVDTGGGPAHANVTMTGYAEIHTDTSGSQGTANTHFGWGVGSSAIFTMSGNSKFYCEAPRPASASESWVLFDIADEGATADITLNDSASISVPAGQVKIGGNLGNSVPGAQATVTLNNSATFSAGGAVLVGESGAQGTINLNGGVFTAPALVTGATGSVATIYFNGGVLKAAPVSDPDLLYYFDATIGKPAKWATGAADFIQGANFTVNVMEGGAKIDTNGLDVTVTQRLHHAGALEIDGGLTKLGDGSLTLTVAQAYTGDTIVNQGALNANAGINTPLATVFVATGATLNATSIVADTLTIGGPAQVAVAAVPEPGTLALLALAGMGALLAAWRRK